MKVYLAGAMTGLPKLNAPEFNRVTKILRKLGHEVYSPAEAFPHDAPFCHKQAWPEYAKALTEADGIVLMHGWRKSLGARAEYMIALNLKLQIFELSCNYDIPEYVLTVKNPDPLTLPLHGDREFVSRTPLDEFKAG